MQHRSETASSPVATVSGVVGVILYLAMGFIYITSGLVVPSPWLFVLWAIWIAGLYLLVSIYRTRRVWTPAVAVGAAIVWWVYLTVGEAVFDWAP